jgi:hypothetical protein
MGFIPGCIILIFIVNKTGCTSPNELKMLELRHQQMKFGEKATCKLKCLSITEKLFSIKMINFKVNYDLSDVHKKPFGLYYLQAIENKDALYEMVIEDRDTISYVDDIKLLTNKVTHCYCDTLK